MESGFVVRFRTFWHNWVPVMMVCGTIVGSVSGGTLWFAQDRYKLFERLGKIEDVEKTLKDNQQVIVENQWEQERVLNGLAVNQQRVLETLHIPPVVLPPRTNPGYVIYPPEGLIGGKRKREPLFPDSQGTKSVDKHSLYEEPDLYAVQPAQDAQIPRMRK